MNKILSAIFSLVVLSYGCYEAYKNISVDQTHEKFNQAIILQNENKSEEALVIYDAILKERDFPDLRINRSKIYSLQGNFSQAQAEIDLALAEIKQSGEKSIFSIEGESPKQLEARALETKAFILMAILKNKVAKNPELSPKALLREQEIIRGYFKQALHLRYLG